MVSDGHAAHMRDLMVRRGPDGSGLVRRGSVILGHRRLAVIDLTEAGAQPATSADGRFSLVYNGELYNDAALRKDLERLGVRFRTACDTETLLAALMQWGTEALHRVRGMFAFGFHDGRTGELLLARDGLGIKPLYWWRSEGGGEFVFASEIPPILAHPLCTAAPDFGAVSAYLSTAKVTTGERTLYEGVRTLEPGHLLRLDLRSERLEPTVRRWWVPKAGARVEGAGVRDAVEESVGLHMRSDVPVCALLSGGLDSSVIATVAAEKHRALRTFCAYGAERSHAGDDAEAAREVAAAIGTDHAEAVVTRESFARDWRWIIEQTGLPLATPNEVAILAVARTLREAGCTVTLSGEGADELFGGYDRTLDPAAEFERVVTSEGVARDSRAYAAMAARQSLTLGHWVAPSEKAEALRPEYWGRAEQDHLMWGSLTERFARAASGGVDDPLRVHFRVLREHNLSELLRRLDSSTMLASVEGRTPLADTQLAEMAERVAMADLFEPGDGDPTPRTKRVLREAFRGRVPGVAVRRAKASFPLPFWEYLAEAAAEVRGSGFVREVFEPEFVEAALRDPAAAVHRAWPLINVGLWGKRFS